MRRIVLAVLLVMAPYAAEAQIIRGVVTERVSGHPLRGVLVSVATVHDSLRPGGIRHTLTNDRGEFALRLSSGGRYLVSAKRIGVARHITDVHLLRDGETRRINLVLDAFAHRLPVVNVVETSLCVRRNEQRRQIVALWDEVRTALLATGVSREEQLLTGWLSKHVRSLEPRTLRILEDRHTVAEGLFEKPIRSLTGDSLATVGYWRKQDADTMVFYAPDEEALLSTAFRGGHCFELVTERDAPRGLVGLAFRPRRATAVGGIQGTIWIDAGNFELRFIEFRYNNLITIPSNPHLGGQVHYLRHPSGAWLVRRWFIRMPLFPEVTTVAEVRAGRPVAPRASIWRVIEEGGGLYTPGLRSWETPGTISGTITDSTGRGPLVGTVVSLSGTPFSVEVDSLGRFRFDSIPPGAYTLLASHASYAALGQMADDEPLTLEAGQVYVANLRAIDTTMLLAVLCEGRTLAPGQAALRLLATDAAGGAALARLPMWLRWPDPDQKEPLNPITPGVERRLLGVQSVTDESGAVTFCGVPSNTQLELVVPTPDDDPEVRGGERVSRVTSFVVRPNELAVRHVTLRRPR